MAKGDMGATKSAAGTGVPKQDQYSVMHSLMDSLGGNSGNSMMGSIGPSVMPRSPDQGQMGITPNSNQFGGNLPQIGYGAQPDNPMGGRMQPMGMPRMGSMYGVTAGAPSIAPSNPQDMMRRIMMNKGVFNQANASNPMI